MRQFSLVIAVVSTLYVSLAWSQPSQPLRVIPLNIMWQTQPSSVPPDPKFVAFQTVDVHWRLYYPNPQNPTRNL
jgi:hypothetical protein